MSERNDKVKKKQGRPATIDLVELNRMLKAGKSQAECAIFFKVSRSSICMAVKKLRGAVTSEVALRAAPQVVAMDLKTIEQFNKINGETNKAIDRLTGYLDGKGKTSMKEADINSLLLKAIAETRAQLKLQQSMLETLSDFSQVHQFQQTVLDIIFEVLDAKQKQTVISKLRQARLSRILTRYN